MIVFARAPRLGTLKRRLAADLGDRFALRFHLATLRRLLRRLRADRRFRTVLAATPDAARRPPDPATLCDLPRDQPAALPGVLTPIDCR